MDTFGLRPVLLSLAMAVIVNAASLSKAGPSISETVQRSYFIAQACERTILTLKCDNDKTIHLVHARYGRQNMHDCSQGPHPDRFLWSNHCTAPVRRTTSVVAQMCNGRRTCVVPVVNMLFSDPCPTTFKYLEIYYTCTES